MQTASQGYFGVSNHGPISQCIVHVHLCAHIKLCLLNVGATGYWRCTFSRRTANVTDIILFSIPGHFQKWLSFDFAEEWCLNQWLFTTDKYLDQVMNLFSIVLTVSFLLISFGYIKYARMYVFLAVYSG